MGSLEHKWSKWSNLFSDSDLAEGQLSLHNWFPVSFVFVLLDGFADRLTEEHQEKSEHGCSAVKEVGEEVMWALCQVLQEIELIQSK